MNKRTGNMIFWSAVAVIALIAMYTFYNNNKTNNEIKQAPETQKEDTTRNSADERPQVPGFKLEDINGKVVELSDYKGKVVVLNFWTTWCKYCVKEMPEFEELGREYEKAGDAAVLAVNVQETPDTVKDYLKGAGLTGLKVLLDESGKVAEAYGVNGYPNTFIIDKDGFLYEYIPGMTNKETVNNIVEKIR